MTAPLSVREIGADESALVWPLFRSIVVAGDTYSYPPDLTFEQARDWWTTPPSQCFVAERGRLVLGCYMLKPNQPGLGDHVANAGYMTAPPARGTCSVPSKVKRTPMVANAACAMAMTGG